MYRTFSITYKSVTVKFRQKFIAVSQKFYNLKIPLLLVLYSKLSLLRTIPLRPLKFTIGEFTSKIENVTKCILALVTWTRQLLENV